MRDELIDWKDAVLGLTDASGNTALDGAAAEAAMGKAGELFFYLADLVAKRRGVAGEDVLSQLLCLTGEEALTDEEAIGLCFLFVLAGLDTVTARSGSAWSVSPAIRCSAVRSSMTRRSSRPRLRSSSDSIRRRRSCRG